MIRVCVLQPFPRSHCIALSWRSCWGCCRSSRKRSPPPPSRWARSAPRCSVLQMHAGSPSSAGAMTNVPMATVQTNIIIRLISSAGRHLMKKNNKKILHLVWFCFCYSVYFSLMLVLNYKSNVITLPRLENNKQVYSYWWACFIWASFKWQYTIYTSVTKDFSVIWKGSWEWIFKCFNLW